MSICTTAANLVIHVRPCKLDWIKFLFQFVSATQLQRSLRDVRGAGAPNVSRSTLRRRLYAEGLHSRVAAVKPRLQAHHKAARRLWGREKRQWRREQWNKCLFTDESRFTLTAGSKRIRVWRRRGERRHNPQLVNAKELFGGGGIMVWGGISYNGKTDLQIINGNLTGLRYRDEILNHQVLPYAGAVGDGFVLVDDNARPHRHHEVDAYLNDNGVDRMDWPSKSPDLNPIEHVWAYMKDKINRRLTDRHGLADLRRMVLQEWENLPQNFINRLIRSMNKRARQCVQYGGDYTDY